MQRVGIVIPVGMPTKEAAECAKLAEERGFESVWTGEAPSGRDAFSRLTAFALSTSKIKIGTGIVNVFTRSPLLIAASAATVDELSGGRMILGLGTGHPMMIEDQLGIPFRTPLQRIRESVEIIKQALTEEAVTFKGSIFTVQNFVPGFRPVRATIPIYLAALGAKMIRLAGEVGEGVLLINNSVDYARQAVRMAEEGAKLAGRAQGKVDMACWIVWCASEDSRTAKNAARRRLAAFGRLPFYQHLFAESGFGHEARLIAEAWRSRREAVKHVSDAMVDALTVTGSPEECRQRLDEYRSAGISLPLISPEPVQGVDRKDSVTMAIDTLSS